MRSMNSTEIFCLCVGVATALLGAVTQSSLTVAIGAGLVIATYVFPNPRSS